MGYTIIIKPNQRERDRQLQSTQAPLSMRGMLSDVIRTPQEARDLAQRMGGHNARPTRPVMVETRHGRTLVVGDGEATADELSELAQRALEKPAPDFDSLREKSGQMRREDVAPKMREAMAARAKRAKANPRTDAAQYIKAAKQARSR